MDRARLLALTVTAAAALLLSALIGGEATFPPLSHILFWVALLIGAELLPVSLGFGTVVTMAFPIHLAVEILFEPAAAMVIVGLGAFDAREIRREISPSVALFNRAQLMLAAAAASTLIHSPATVFSFPQGALAISAGAFAHVIVNLGLVGLYVTERRNIPLPLALRSLVPDPASGFFASQALLAALGAVTAAAYLEIGAFVVAFLIPLLFARLSLLGARAQQELAERVRKQQQGLLVASERVFGDRERERKRIAAEIHDSSLQMLAAAGYACGNANEYLATGRTDEAREAIVTARGALDGAMASLRESLVDLRESSVEEGGLMETIHKFADQLSTLWNREIRIEGEIAREPPIPVALAAFQILQEGLVNALKHADTEMVTVKMSELDGMVHLTVEDEGAGFDPSIDAGSEHVGMRLMRERAESVGGRIELESTPGQGTRVEAILPAGLGQ